MLAEIRCVESVEISCEHPENERKTTSRSSAFKQHMATSCPFSEYDICTRRLHHQVESSTRTAATPEDCHRRYRHWFVAAGREIGARWRQLSMHILVSIVTIHDATCLHSSIVVDLSHATSGQHRHSNFTRFVYIRFLHYHALVRTRLCVHSRTSRST